MIKAKLAAQKIVNYAFGEDAKNVRTVQREDYTHTRITFFGGGSITLCGEYAQRVNDELEKERGDGRIQKLPRIRGRN